MGRSGGLILNLAVHCIEDLSLKIFCAPLANKTLLCALKPRSPAGKVRRRRLSSRENKSFVHTCLADSC